MSYLIRTYIRADVYVQAHIITVNIIALSDKYIRKIYIQFFAPLRSYWKSHATALVVSAACFQTESTNCRPFRCPRPYLTENTICDGASRMRTAPR